MCLELKKHSKKKKKKQHLEFPTSKNILGVYVSEVEKIRSLSFGNTVLKESMNALSFGMLVLKYLRQVSLRLGSL